MQTYEKILEILINERNKKRLTQAQLASRLNRPQSFVAKYETNTRRLNVIEFMAICKALQIRPSKLMVLVQ